ncbi:hypothetical protein F4804DRAFT_327901 [Jackrogersella minutella]|nr:hypothetical protein F4804DRAFT_327901 [Jackrogersella minutella]
MGNNKCLSPSNSSPPRKRPSSDAEHIEHLNKRAKSTITGIFEDFQTISAFILQWTEIFKDLDKDLENHAQRTSLILSRKWSTGTCPEDQLHRMNNLREKFKQISQTFSNAKEILETLFSSTNAVNDIHDNFVRLGLPSDFWFDRAVEFCHRITIPEYPRWLISIIKELWILEEDYAEHFCRLPATARREFLRYLRHRTKSSSPEEAYEYAEIAFQSKVFRHRAGYDTRSVSEWAAEDFVFGDWGSSPATD